VVGSVNAISDGTGAATTINKYDEYGIPGSTNAGRFQYTGQTWLPEIGMFYYKARIYSPTLGRVMQTDPIGYGDGINWYNYVGSDPINYSDPLGLEDSRGPDIIVTARTFYARVVSTDGGGGGGGRGGRKPQNNCPTPSDARAFKYCLFEVA
jgi:RHS repeat-associated protein